MKENWKERKLEDVCEVIGGGTPSKANSKFYNGEIPWATVRDMKSDLIEETEHKITGEAVKSSSTNIIPKGNVIIATRVGLGKVCLLMNDTAINQDLKGIIPKNPAELSVGYLFRWLKSIAYIIEKEGTGATVQGVKLPFVKSLLIPIPSTPEQQHIVSVLDETFAAIDKAKENAGKNLQNAHELYDSYLQSVFANQGDRWENKKLGEVCSLITDGKHGDCNNEENSGYYFLSAKDVKNSTLNYENARQITKVDFEETHRRTNLKPGDVLVTNSGTIGRMAIAPFDDKTYRTTFQKSVAVIKPIPEFINNVYCCYHLEADLSKLVNVSAGTAQKNLLLGDLKKHVVFLPSICEQQSIVAKLDALSSETKKLEAIYQQKLAVLDELKKSVLQKAFKGELTGA